MKRIGYNICVLVILFILLINGCAEYPAIQEPDTEWFNQTVHSPALRDSLLAGKLTAGMPYFVASQLFEDWTPSIMETKIPVASLGSKQRLEETEGLGRVYVNPNVQVHLDEYEMDNGKLYVWYRRPDFYTMDVSARDTLYIFLEDTVICSVIKCLTNSSELTIRDSISQVPDVIYAEVHYNNRKRKSSYWYDLIIEDDGRTFSVNKMKLNFEIYPIEYLEFNGEPVSSFKWR